MVDNSGVQNMEEDTLSNDNTHPRKRRNDRARKREYNHVMALWEQVRMAMLGGYSHETWEEAAGAWRRLSGYLSPEEYRDMGALWSRSWAEDLMLTEVDMVMERFKERMEVAFLGAPGA